MGHKNGCVNLFHFQISGKCLLSRCASIFYEKVFLEVFVGNHLFTVGFEFTEPLFFPGSDNVCAYLDLYRSVPDMPRSIPWFGVLCVCSQAVCVSVENEVGRY